MTDDTIRRALRELPRVDASPGFTGRVVGRLDRRPRHAGRIALAAAAALILAAAGIGALEIQKQNTHRAELQQLARLRAEQDSIARELDRLRQQSDELRPVFYIGGTDHVDLVVDPSRAAVRPASYRPGGH